MFEQTPTPDLPPPPAVAVPTTRVQARRGIGLRWVVAALAIVLLGTVSFAGYRLLAASGANSGTTLAGQAPKNSVVYAEFHLDAPGDQHEKLGAFLAHFPAFGSASDLDTRLNELYDKLVRRASHDSMSWSADIAPWFGGTVGFAITRLPKIPQPSTSGPHIEDPGAVVLIALKDKAAATAWIAKVAAKADGTPTTETYAGITLTSVGKGSYAVTDTAIVVGDTASVKQALDDGTAGGLASVKTYADAAKTTTGASLGTAYVDVNRYMDWLTSAAPNGLTCAAATDNLPAWYGGSFAADSAALHSTVSWPHVANGVNAANAAPSLTAHIPSTALAVVDERELGAYIRTVVEQFQKCDTASSLGDIQKGIDALGGWDKLTGWIGETALVLDRNGSQPTGGVLIVPKDRATAENFALQMKNLAALAGGIAATDAPYAGTTITSFEIPDAPMRFGYAFADGYVVVGPEAWVKKVLDTAPGDALSTNARFTSALAQASPESTALMYADVTGLRTWLEGAMSPADKNEYEEYLKAYVTPFDVLVTTTKTGSDLDRVDGVLTVK